MEPELLPDCTAGWYCIAADLGHKAADSDTAGWDTDLDIVVGIVGETAVVGTECIACLDHRAVELGRDWHSMLWVLEQLQRLELVRQPACY